MKTTFFFFLAFGFSFLAKAQSVFTDADKAFFAKQIPEMRVFLQNKGISEQHIKFLDISIVPNKKGKPYVALRLETVDTDFWLNVRENYKQQFGRSLEKDVFDKLVFLCEVDAADALLSIYAQDQTGKYQLFAGLESEKNYAFDIKENKPRAEVIKKFSLPKYALPQAQSLKEDKLLENINEKIIRILKKYYEGKGAFWQDAKFEVLSAYPDDLRLRVSNLKKEVFNEDYYFELIYITVNFRQEAQEKLDFSCTVNAKYGTSILFAPRNTEYKDIGRESKYQDYIDDYSVKIRDLLYQDLKK